MQRWGPKTIGVGTQQREYSTIYSVCKCGFSIYRKKPHWKGWFYMVVRIITIIAAVAFAKDSETVIDAEFKAQPMDKEGTLILYTEDIDKTE